MLDVNTFSFIKRIDYSIYSLSSKKALNSKSQTNFLRQGALLRVHFIDGKIGYADCHPWEELGDLPLQGQLKLLSQKKITSITNKSIYFSGIDAKYRDKNTSVFSKRSLIKNHYITSYENFTNDDILKSYSAGFKYIKFKFGMNIVNEVKFLKDNYENFRKLGIRLRLDFNCSLTFLEACNFLSKIINILDIIDFIEDICTFNYQEWKEIQKIYKVNLALDNKDNLNLTTNKNINKFFYDMHESFNIIIIKPAKDNLQNLYLNPPKQRVIFTSYMDHPLGQLCSMYEAMCFYENFPDKEEPCGFLTHSLYSPNDYTKLLEIKETTLNLIKPATGFGFDALFNSENWENIYEL